MPAHSWAAPGGVRIQISIENSHRHEPPRSMNCGTRVSTRCRCPTSVPAERCSSHSGWPGRVHQKRSGNDPPPRSPPGHGTAPTPSQRTWCCEKNCCQSSIRLGTGRIPREKFLDPIEQRVRISHVWGKQCRRVATRYDKFAANYLAFVELASNRLWLRANASTPWMIDVPGTARFV